MNKERLRQSLVEYEKCNLNRHAVPTDDVDIDHIGYGFNLETAWDDELLDYLSVADEDDIQTITQEQADYIFDWFINLAEKDAISVFPKKWESLTPIRKEVLVNLSYNLGLPTLKQFRRMIAAIRAENWGEAARQMLDSDAARQTGDRYHKLASAFESDTEAPLQLPQLFDPPVETPTIQLPPRGDNTLSNTPAADMLRELLRRTGD